MAAKSAYETPSREIAELFADYLEGDAARPALAISERPLPAPARNALERSFEAFGYTAPACTYVTLAPKNPEAEGGDIQLDPQSLFLLVESLDPLFIISADATTTRALAKAYRTEPQIAAAAPARIFGRPAATFTNLPDLLKTDPGKQKAWHTLKSLK